MSQELLNELISKSEWLNNEEKLQLMRYLSSNLKRDDNSPSKPRHKWREIRGIAPNLLNGKDAQEWVNELRREWERRDPQVF